MRRDRLLRIDAQDVRSLVAHPFEDAVDGRLDHEELDEGLVDRDEALHPIAEGVEDDLGILLKPGDGAFVRPAAPLGELLGHVPMIEGDDRLDTVREEIVDELAIMGKPCRVHLSRAVGQDARPGDGETIGVDAQPFHERDILKVLLPVVEIIGDIPSFVLADHRFRDLKFIGVDIPIGRAFAIQLIGALDLIGRGGHSPKEGVFREVRGGSGGREAKTQGENPRGSRDLPLDRTHFFSRELTNRAGRGGEDLTVAQGRRPCHTPHDIRRGGRSAIRIG